MSKTNTLLIRTPEGIVFSQLLASPMTRFIAWLIDQVCLWGATLVLGMIFGVFGLLSAGLAQAFHLIAYFVLSIGYGLILEWYWRGQTLGKRTLRLRVVDAEGLRLHFSQIAIRNLLRFIDMFPLAYGVGGVACLLSRRSQRLGDFAANTVVIRHARMAQPKIDPLLAGKYNSLRQYRHLEARLRQRVSAAEAGIAFQAILRRDLLDPQARVDLFAAIAEQFRAKVRFPEETIEGLADEQYVRNVVDVLYRARSMEGKAEPARTPIHHQDPVETSP